MKKGNPLKLNLQMFAEETGTEVKPPEGNTTGQETSNVVGLTAEELQKKIESESDRKLASALKKKEDEFNQKLQDAIEKAKEEGKSYAQMSKEQQANAESEKERLEFEREREEFRRERLTVEVRSDLQERKLPIQFAEALIHIGEKEKIAEAVAGIESVWNETIQAKIKEALVQDTPFVGKANKKAVNKFAEEANQRRKSKEAGPNPWARD